VEDLSDGLSRNSFTSVDLVRAYKAKIEEVNDTFRAVIQISPDAEDDAVALDEERRISGPRR